MNPFDSRHASGRDETLAFKLTLGGLAVKFCPFVILKKLSYSIRHPFRLIFYVQNASGTRPNLGIVHAVGMTIKSKVYLI